MRFQNEERSISSPPNLFTHYTLHPNCSMDVPKDQLSTLLDHGLYSSAQMLGCFAVSSTSINSETSPHLKAESLVLFGDSLFREKEYRRAIQIYKQALQYHKVLPKQNAANTPTTRSVLSGSNRSSSPNSCNSSVINENEVKFKIASCHSSLGENRAALAEMEGIPSKSRNLEMNLMMAKLYRNSRHIRAAIGCFKECLRNCPYIIEAIIALAELGVSAKDIMSLFPQLIQPFSCQTRRITHAAQQLGIRDIRSSCIPEDKKFTIYFFFDMYLSQPAQIRALCFIMR